MSRQEDYINAGIKYRFENGKPMAIGGDNFAEMTRDYSLSLNAGNGHSHPCSESSKKAISEMRKRSTASESTREKIREANKKTCWKEI